MNRIVRFSALAASAGAAALLLSFTSAGPAVAQTFKPVMSMVINSADHPVPIIDVGAAAPVVREPFQHHVASSIQGSQALRVPDDKRLVIEFYSGAVATEAPCATAAMTIRTQVGDVAQLHRLLAVPIVQGQPSDFNEYVVTEQVRIYADPGTFVNFATYTIPQCGSTFFGMASGYLIDAGAGQ